MLRHLFVVALSLLLTITLSSSYCPSDIKIVLIGIVLDTEQAVIDNATVELLDLVTQEKQISQASSDGQFTFNLYPDRTYELTGKDGNGDIVHTKQISTINKYDPEILFAILSQSAY